MANTLKFGNGTWATKEGSTLAYNDENGNFKPLPFDFSRNTTATRVNKEGLIEVVSNNEPRIDFLNDSDGALKLEPQSTNQWYNSSDFTQSSWIPTNVTITLSSEISPDGTLNAYKITDNSTNGEHRIRGNSFFVPSGANFSIFAKAAEYSFFAIANLSDGFTINFDLYNGTIVSVGSGWSDAKIENYGNGWYRCSGSISINKTCGYGLLNDSGDFIFSGDGTKGVHIWGPQFEDSLSYATSYIPTQGSAATRVADECNNGANEQVINSTEGVLYVEMNAFDNISRISLSDGTTSNRVSFRITDDNIDFQYRVGGSYSYRVDVDIDTSNTNKIAMSFNNGIFVGYLNGVAIGSPISGPSLSQGVLDRLNFNDGNSSDSFEGNIKEVQIYNTALTDQELINLTTL